MKYNRIIIFFIFLGAFAAAYQIGSFSEVNDEEARKFIEEFEELVKDIDAVGIFLHIPNGVKNNSASGGIPASCGVTDTIEANAYPVDQAEKRPHATPNPGINIGSAIVVL